MIIIAVIIIATVVFFYYGWRAVCNYKEEKLRESELYRQAEQDLEELQEKRPWGDEPIRVSFILETGEFCPLEIMVFTDGDGRLVLPMMKPSEFIVAVRMVRKMFLT